MAHAYSQGELRIVGKTTVRILQVCRLQLGWYYIVTVSELTTPEQRPEYATAHHEQARHSYSYLLP